jgi:superfamily I DNA and RNA helicase
MQGPGLEIVRGQTRNRIVAEKLVTCLERHGVTGTLYLGYPVIASADDAVHVDALLVSARYGLVAFLLEGARPQEQDGAAWDQLRNEQDGLYMALESHLSRHQTLRKGRKLGVAFATVTVFPDSPGEQPKDAEGVYCGLDELPERLDERNAIDERFVRPLQAALQRVTTIKPAKKRRKVQGEHTRGRVMTHIEREIANLDRWQKYAAIESPEGPQRIRGLAGSGKTVVLAHKAAYFHAQNPDWDIGVTFHTWSLYQQFKDLIRRFAFEHLGDEPDWDKLHILHSWGSRFHAGMYSQIADACSLPRRDFLYAKSMYGRDDAFAGICGELLSASSAMNDKPLYDAVLIDEAQDLPPGFFQLVYRFTREPKRIVFAYDELQKLSEVRMPSAEELFGRDEHGRPRVELHNRGGEPHQDVTLPVCYRNTPWALTVAHALGFGLHGPKGPVQHFDEPELWTEIGYRVRGGELKSGSRVILDRDPRSYPDYFNQLIESEDAVTWQRFDNAIEQAAWVARSVRENIANDELDIDDILIVMPDAFTAKSRSPVIRQALADQGLTSHLAGVDSSQDELFLDHSVASAHIHRAKGNEAPMVYVLNCHDCAEGINLITKRNTLFTAITRSRAWVRLCGVGPAMDALIAEADKVVERDFTLDFRVPTPDELSKMRTLHRDRDPEAKKRAAQAQRMFKQLLEALGRGDIEWEHLPAKERVMLQQFMGQEDPPDNDSE